MVTEVVGVRFAGKEVGAVSFDTDTGSSAFEYASSFVREGLELSPIVMPLQERLIYQFPGLDYDTFRGLPGLLADSLPDDFGNAVLNAWVARQGRSPKDITPLQRLQYIGKRGMGALEFVPATQLKTLAAAQGIAIKELVAIAQTILDERANFKVNLRGDERPDADAMLALLSVGTSAGGARPKAVLAFDATMQRCRSGQARIPDGYTHYLMKFDGVVEHQRGTETFGDPQGFTVMEYAYHLLARQCGITMMPCRLLNEGPRRHFLTERFDRVGNNKVHVQTLNALTHASYKNVGSYSYEEAFGVLRKLGLPATAADELFRRMVFNVVARNQDDHTKNFAFILDSDRREWRLAPAYDLAYSYRPGSRWVDVHAMTINGKRDNFTRQDFYAFGSISPRFSRNYVDQTINRTIDCVSMWRQIASDVGVPASLIDMIEANLRLSL